MVAVDELTQVERWYSAALGQSGKAVARSVLGAEGLRFQIGPHSMEFLMPSNPSSPLADWTRTYGPSPYSATLRSQIGPRTLDQRLLHGAKIELTGAK